MSLEQGVTSGETLGFIEGHTAVVQEQSQTMNATTNRIKQLTDTVENLIKITVATSHGLRLRLPNLVLPEFTGRVTGSFFYTRYRAF